MTPKFAHPQRIGGLGATRLNVSICNQNETPGQGIQARNRPTRRTPDRTRSRFRFESCLPSRHKAEPPDSAWAATSPAEKSAERDWGVFLCPRRRAGDGLRPGRPGDQAFRSRHPAFLQRKGRTGLGLGLGPEADAHCQSSCHAGHGCAGLDLDTPHVLRKQAQRRPNTAATARDLRVDTRQAVTRGQAGPRARYTPGPPACQRSKAGLFGSNFQPGIRLCMATASSREPRPCCL